MKSDNPAIQTGIGIEFRYRYRGRIGKVPGFIRIGCIDLFVNLFLECGILLDGLKNDMAVLCGLESDGWPDDIEHIKNILLKNLSVLDQIRPVVINGA